MKTPSACMDGPSPASSTALRFSLLVSAMGSSLAFVQHGYTPLSSVSSSTRSTGSSDRSGRPVSSSSSFGNKPWRTVGGGGGGGGGYVGRFTRPSRAATALMARNLYEVLGVPLRSEVKEVKSAYRKLARRYHPDVNPDKSSLDMFKEMTAAYNILSDPEQKNRYDLYGEAGISGADPAGGYGGGVEVDLTDIFDSFFGREGHAGGQQGGHRAGGSRSQGGGTRSQGGGMGGMGGGMGGVGGGMGGDSGMGGFSSFSTPGRGGTGSRGSRSRAGAGQQQRSGPQRGADLELNLEVDFVTACFGGVEKVRIRHQEGCSVCNSTGVGAGGSRRSCGSCGGSGVITTLQQTPLGNFSTQTPCPSCNGVGESIDFPCQACNGKGVVQRSKKMDLAIPCGVDDGMRLTVQGEGDAGPMGGPSGQLYVVLSVRKDPGFNRKGSDIYSDLNVDYTTAILGESNVRVRTIDGEVDIRLPKGSQPGTVLRIKGKGVPELTDESRRGDHFVSIKVDIPSSADLNPDEVELLRELSQMSMRRRKNEWAAAREAEEARAEAKREAAEHMKVNSTTAQATDRGGVSTISTKNGGATVDNKKKGGFFKDVFGL